MNIKTGLTYILFLFILQSCGDGNNSSESKDFSKSLERMNGIYVSEGYTTRDNGSDWMAVSVIPINETEAQVNIRSRVDNDKTATCTYAATSKVSASKTLTATFPDKESILFFFKTDQLSIKEAPETDAAFLQSFCTDGNSIAGTYQKLTEPLDDAQLLKGGFIRSLSMNGITFNIQASSTGSSNSLLITPSGLKGTNDKIVTTIKGFLTDAVVQDLNDDGWPELLLFNDLGKSKKTGNVIAYSVKDGKSLTTIAYPNTFLSDQISEGYMGQDKFSVVKNQLIQEFPVHTPDGKLTSKTRQVSYKLISRESVQLFEVDQIVEN